MSLRWAVRETPSPNSYAERFGAIFCGCSTTSLDCEGKPTELEHSQKFPIRVITGFQCRNNILSRLWDGTSTSFHWKFLQDTATGTLCLVPRDRPHLVLEPDPNGSLALNPYPKLLIQRLVPSPTTCASSCNESGRWQIIRSTGTCSETKIARGTYTISLYSPPNPFSLQGPSNQISQNLTKPIMHTSQISTYCVISIEIILASDPATSQSYTFMLGRILFLFIPW